jgi:hypothetical protein
VIPNEAEKNTATSSYDAHRIARLLKLACATHADSLPQIQAVECLLAPYVPLLRIGIHLLASLFHPLVRQRQRKALMAVFAHRFNENHLRAEAT